MTIFETKNAMIRFLLGEMSDQERANFEEEYIKDTDLFHSVVELENDLIDLYARGLFSRSERTRLEHSFLADPERRKRLSFARALARCQAQDSPSFLSSGLQLGHDFAPLRPAYKNLMLVAAIAFFAMLIATSWLAVQNNRLRTALQASQKQLVVAQQSAAGVQEQVDALTKKLNRSSQSSEETGTGGVLLSLTLKSDSLRNASAMSILRVSSSTSSIALHLILPADDSFNYNASVETAAGSRIWYQENIMAKAGSAGTKEIVAIMPARLLKGSDYVVRITTRTAHGAEDVAGYSFRVSRQ